MNLAGNPNNLPRHATPFIGREDEIAQLVHLLHGDHCALLTLVGSGGSGKTRLALEVARQITTPADIFFVPLQPLRSAEHLVTAIVDVLPLQLTDNDNPYQRLLDYLSDKNLLLVLDNFEHLLDGVALVTDLLSAAPHVKLLVTSRERLNLMAEQVWPVQGLDVPENSADMPDTHSAVQLFVERAQRVQPAFSLDAQRDAVVRICQVVEGLPLALELAASWVRAMSCAAIADEIQHNIDLLETSQRDVPERHRSMRAVFDHSWQLLAEEEQTVFAKLSVFRGGFTVEAAEQVAGASLHTLAALIDKSLVTVDADGRYDLHELLRQYAEIHIQIDITAFDCACRNHARYYIEYLQSKSDIVEGGPQGTATMALSLEIENLRSVWRWVIDHDPALPGPAAPFTMGKFLQHRSRYIEGRTLFESLVLALDQPDAAPRQRVTLFETLGQLGWSYIRTGYFDQAQETLEQQDAVMQSLDPSLLPSLTPEPHMGLSLIASLRGDYEKALAFGEQARQRSIQYSNRRNLMMASYVLVNPLRAQGRYEEANHYAKQNYDIAREQNNHWFMALALDDLGSIAQLQGDFQAAKKFHQESCEINLNHFHDRGGVARSLNLLAAIARREENYTETWSLYRKSLDIYRENGDRIGLTETLTGLAKLACVERKYPLARQHLHVALQHARPMGLMPLTLAVLLVVAELLLRQQHSLEGTRLLSFIHWHPATEYAARQQADQLREAYQSRMNANAFDSGWSEGQRLDVDTLLVQLEAELSSTNSRSPQKNPNEATLQSLTSREREVLALIAEGLSDKEIAQALGLAPGTVKWFGAQIRGKLTVHSRTRAVVRARELGILD